MNHHAHDNNNIIIIEDKGFASRRLFDAGFGANTKIYGLFSPNVGKVKAIRHTISPSLNFSYQPDFSSRAFGYYQTIADSLKAIQEYDKFSNSIFGGTPRGRIQSLSFNMQNLLQMKTLNGESESKFDLFNLDFSTGYNFTADEFKFGDLRTSFRTLSFFDIDVSAVHSLYQFDKEKGAVVNKYIKGFPRLVFFQTATNFRLTGRKETPAIPSELAPEEKYEDTTKEDKEERFIEDVGSPQMNIPWNLSMDVRYSVSKYNPSFPDERFSLAPKLDFKLSKNWKIDYSAHYDLLSRQITYHDFTFYRDLHCWEMRFDWTPSGARKGFFIIIRIKNPNFKDLKVEKKSYGGSVLGRGF